MSQVSTVPGTLLGLFGGAAYFGSLDTDPTKPIMVRNLSFVRILLTLSRALTLLCFTARLPPCACVRVHLLVFSSNSLTFNSRRFHGRTYCRRSRVALGEEQSHRTLRLA